MPEFVNPFSGVLPERKMASNELTRAIRLNLAAEQEAIHLYQVHADATDNELAKKVLLHIADEEREHVGELQRLLNILLEDEEQLLAGGAEEVDEMAGSQFTIHPNPSPVCFGHHFAESQPQAPRVFVSFLTALHLTKVLEDPGAVFFWYAWIIIRY